MKTLMKSMAVAMAVAVAAPAAPAEAGAILDAIKARKKLVCGVNTGLGGFSIADSAGKWVGLDVDVCRAVAAALFGDGNAIEFRPTSAQQRFPALQSGEVDILSRNTTITLSRDTSLGFNFAPVTFYDGQGFMVHVKAGVKSAKELANATICVQPGTTTELNLADYFRAQNMQFKAVVIENIQEVNKAFFDGRCDVLTTDASGLAAVRAKDAKNPADYVILPELISKEPLGPAVRHGDDQFFDIVKWTVYALFAAEEFGVNSKNVDQMVKESKDPAVQRLLGVTPGNGKALGVDEDWVVKIIKAVGNYGEIYERNITPLGIPRGINAPWTKGGLMYAPPLQ